ncbi:MAG: hypothetical protein V7647_3017 [Acidobacteriota bacterium]
MFYPSLAAERSEPLGPFTESIARDGALAPGATRLVVVSHGTGSMPLLHRGLAIHLAQHGFVVAAPEHPGDSRTDHRLAGTEANLRNRPRHLTAVIDWMFDEPFFRASLLPHAAAVVGHSLGGYTALAIAGGRPAAFPWEADSGQSSPVDVTPDPRVRSLVLLAPAAAWFLADGALERVSIPILMMTGENDDLEIAGHKTLPDGRVVFMPWGHSEIIKRGISSRSLIDHRTIPNAGHYSFMTPYPAAMRTPAVPPSQDPVGFDRVGFYEQLCADVLSFLQKTLTA